MHNRLKDLRMMAFKPCLSKRGEPKLGREGGEETGVHGHGQWAGSLMRTQDKWRVRF